MKTKDSKIFKDKSEEFLVLREEYTVFTEHFTLFATFLWSPFFLCNLMNSTILVTSFFSIKKYLFYVSFSYHFHIIFISFSYHFHIIFIFAILKQKFSKCKLYFINFKKECYERCN